jgi:hypothetical protein
LSTRGHGLLRVETRGVDPALATTQELAMAVVPKPRDTGVNGIQPPLVVSAKLTAANLATPAQAALSR